MPRTPRQSLSQFAESYRRTYKRPADAPEYFCQCGCNELIPWKPSHRTRPPRFILVHYLRDGTSLRIQKLRESKVRERMTPPPDWIPPTGFCECGCGQTTKIADCSRPKHDEYIGYPLRWRHGHYGRFLLARRGDQHPRWKGGRAPAEKSGYIRIHRPEHPGANRDGYVLEHRYVYETSRNVILPSTVSVHHVNGDKTDNRPENLVATTRREHIKVHNRAGQVIGLFVDDKLLEAAKAHVRSHGELPDLEALTRQIYGE